MRSATVSKSKASAATRADFLDQAEEAYRAAFPLVRFINQALGLKM